MNKKIGQQFIDQMIVGYLNDFDQMILILLLKTAGFYLPKNFQEQYFQVKRSN